MTSIIHLRSLQNFQIDELLNVMERHAYQWNAEKKCSCIPISFVAKKGDLIVCRHLKIEQRKIFGREIDRQFARAVLLGKLALVKVNAERTEVRD